MRFLCSFIIITVSFLAPILAIGQELTYYQCVDSATNCVDLKRFEDAEKWYLAALRLEPANPGNAMLLSNLCLTQIELNKYDEADKSIEIALARMPDNSLFRRNKALVSIAKDNADEALKNIDFVLKSDPNNTSLLLMRACIYLNSKNFTQAQEDFNTIIGISPDCEDALIGLASCHENAGDWDNAITCYTKVLDINPTAEVYFLRGKCKTYKEDYTSANEDIVDGIRLDAEYAPIYALRGYISKRCYRNEEYEADKKLAIKYGADAQLIQWMSE